MTRKITKYAAATLALVFIPCCLRAQEESARNAAKSLALSLGYSNTEDLVLDGHGNGVWCFATTNGVLTIYVDDFGHARGLSDLAADDAVTNRKPGSSHKITNSEQAIGQARELLGRWVADFDAYSVEEVRGIDEVQVDPGRNNFADRVTVFLLKKVRGYPGHLGQATICFDAVTGKCINFGIGPSLNYEEPRARLSPEDAARRMRQIADAQLNDAKAQGDLQLATGLEAVRDQLVPSELILGVDTGDRAILGSDYGQQLKDSQTARLCYAWGKDGFSLAIDAENGEPVSCRIARSATVKSKSGRPALQPSNSTGRRIAGGEVVENPRTADRNLLATVTVGSAVLALSAIVFWIRATRRTRK